MICPNGPIKERIRYNICMIKDAISKFDNGGESGENFPTSHSVINPIIKPMMNPIIWASIVIFLFINIYRIFSDKNRCNYFEKKDY